MLIILKSTLNFQAKTIGIIAVVKNNILINKLDNTTIEIDVINKKLKFLLFI